MCMHMYEAFSVSYVVWLLVGVRQGTFHSACLPDGYNGTWKHGGHKHTLKSVILCDLLLLILILTYYVEILHNVATHVCNISYTWCCSLGGLTDISSSLCMVSQKNVSFYFGLQLSCFLVDFCTFCTSGNTL